MLKEAHIQLHLISHLLRERSCPVEPKYALALENTQNQIIVYIEDLLLMQIRLTYNLTQKTRHIKCVSFIGH